ncbi:30S ribosomal protein S6, partial [Rickettsiales bacterium]|nr:30S ribosomal protein S6 [Rickettsiales bacterium]
MNLYESVFVFSGNLTEKLAEDKVTQYEEIIKKSGGKTLKKEYWGLRTLAYKIKKNLKGHYFLLNFETKYEAIIEVENK